MQRLCVPTFPLFLGEWNCIKAGVCEVSAQQFYSCGGRWGSREWGPQSQEVQEAPLHVSWGTSVLLFPRNTRLISSSLLQCVLWV